MKDAANALRWCVAEMERRYQLMSALGVRNIGGYNKKIREARARGVPLKDPIWKPSEAQLDIEESMNETRPELDTLPFIVVVIDDWAYFLLGV